MPDEKHARDLVNDDALDAKRHDVSAAGEGGSQSSQQNIGPSGGGREGEQAFAWHMPPH
jgi:hypothetical protein